MTTRATSFFGELWLGLRRPSWLAIVVALAVPACTLAFLTRWLTPATLVARAGYFASDPLDTTLWVSARLERLRQASEGGLEGPLLAVVGSSGLAEALSNASALADACEATFDREVRVADLACFGQSVLDTVALMERLPDRFDGVVVANVSPRLIGRGWRYEKPFGNRMALRSPAVENLVRHDGVDMPALSGNYLLDHRWFFLPRLWKALWHGVTGPVTERRHPYCDAEVEIEEQHYEEQLNRVRLSYETYEENFDFALKLFASVGTSLEARGRVRVVLLEAPIRPEALDATYGQEAFARHQERMREYAKQNGFEYWNLNEEAELTDESFYDYTHLWREEAQRRYTEVLGRRSGALLKELLQ